MEDHSVLEEETMILKCEGWYYGGNTVIKRVKLDAGLV